MANVRVQAAAEYLGLSKSTLDKLRMGTSGPRFFKLGKAVVYSTDELDAWMRDRARNTTWSFANDNVKVGPPVSYGPDGWPVT